MNNIVFYSTNTRLAYHISEWFFGGVHYVWCSPVFDPETLDEYSPFKKIPPSSSPCEIYRRHLEDFKKSDMHSLNIKQNKTALNKAALIKFHEGVIDGDDLLKINEIIESATIDSFEPLIYVIPSHIVNSKIKKVPVKETANPLSIEYRIEDLSRAEFDIIKISK